MKKEKVQKHLLISIFFTTFAAELPQIRRKCDLVYSRKSFAGPVA